MSTAQRALPLCPDFIIVGAMKCGTTSLHKLLSAHPKIFVPPGEVNLFTVDEIEQFPQSFSGVKGNWKYQHFEHHFETYAAWYGRLFEEATTDQLRGEDSVTYLASRRALERIAQYAPQAKLIVLLRDPVNRVYSQYWHWVRTGRAFYSLEDTIRFQGSNLLQRSYYEEQLSLLYSLVPVSQVKVILFEEFVQDPIKSVRNVERFLDLCHTEALGGTDHYANKGTYPRRLSVALLRNRLMRDQWGMHHTRRLPNQKRPPTIAQRTQLRKLGRWVLDAAAGRASEPPEVMHSGTRAFLSDYLRDRNAGLPDLLGRNLSLIWPTFRP